MNWTNITTQQIESGEFGETNIFEAFRDNVHAAYSNSERITSVAISPWTVPAGVYRIKITATGAGGSGGTNAANHDNGGATTILDISAGGGTGGGPAAGSGYGGTATGGDININGGDAIRDNGGMSYWGSQGVNDAIAGPITDDNNIGAGGIGNNNDYGGGAGATSIGVFEVEPGQEVAFIVAPRNNGWGGAPDLTGGRPGLIIIEY